MMKLSITYEEEKCLSPVTHHPIHTILVYGEKKSEMIALLDHYKQKYENNNVHEIKIYGNDKTSSFTQILYHETPFGVHVSNIEIEKV